MINLREILLRYKLSKQIELNPKIIELKINESLETKKHMFIHRQNVGI